MKKFILFFLVVLVIGIGIAACATGRAGYKSAPYQTTQQEGPFEVREYPALQLATTGLNGEDKSFRRLFNYISGQNETKEKIAMTTPVFMDGTSMSFVMPESMKQAIPRPAAGEVEIKSQSARRVACYRFSGGRTPESEKEALKLLEEWMLKNNLRPVAPRFFAYYDPPWTPGPWRRNEVLVPVQE